MEPYLPEMPAKILVVDDHRASVESMRAVLEVLGEEVLTATSADEALRHLLQHDIAVIVLDVIMPGIDGFQLASLIRERERCRYTPIIFLTGLGKEHEYILEGYRSGAVDYLTKPCDPDVLRSKVKVFSELSKKTIMLQRYAEVVDRKNAELKATARKLEAALDRTLHINAILEHEIAERKRAETIRDRLAGQLGATPDFVEAMAEGAVTLAMDEVILYCNNRFGSMLGRTADELMGRPLTDFLEPAAVPVFHALFAEARQGSVKTELCLLGTAGERIPAQLALNSFRAIDFEAIAMVVTDLRDHKRTEEVLAQGRLSQQIVEHSLCGIAVCDAAGRIILGNSELAQICGCDPLFKPFSEAFPLTLPEQQQTLAIDDLLQGRIQRSTEVELHRAEKRKLTLLLSAGPLRTVEGYAGCVITMVDISERKRVEEVLRRSEKLAAAGRIAAALAHEVNNPLTAVLNLLFLLESNGSLDEAGRRYLSMASLELARVSNIVRRTLAFYRESSSPVAVRLDELVENVLSLFERDITSRRVAVHTQFDYDEEIVAFPGEMRQVMTNLLTNAIEAVPDGGRIVVRVRRGRDWKTGECGARIVVADSGAGIQRAHRSRLFEPFFTTKGEKGTGLGLWVTQGIVHKHKGSLRVSSSTRDGTSGTVFSVFIPHIREAGAAASGASETVIQNQVA